MKVPLSVIGLPLRASFPALLLGLALPGALAFDAARAPAAAQARLDARYTASLAGIPLGKGAWIIDIGESEYSAAASGVTTGLVKVFTGGEGSGTTRGALVAGQFVPAAYAATVTTGRKTEDVRIQLANGNVKDFAISPTPPPPARGTVPLTEAHRRGVLDPMSASFVRAPGNGDVLSPEVCKRHLAVFDARMRYDLDFEFKRMDKVKAEKGYQGPVVVCAVYFSPVAGHVPTRRVIKYLTQLRDMEVWLAPLDGTRVFAPFRFSMPTPLGLGVVEATDFVVTSTPAPPRASTRGQ